MRCCTLIWLRASQELQPLMTSKVDKKVGDVRGVAGSLSRNRKGNQGSNLHKAEIWQMCRCRMRR